MKSRGIAAGASVIVLALTAAGQSTAAGLGDIAPKVDAEAGTGVDANVQLGGVKTQVTLDAYQWSASHGAGVGHGTAAAGGVKVKGDGSGVPSVGEHQTGHLDGPARPGRSDRTQVKRGHSSVNGGSRFSTQADLRIARHARVKSHARNHASVAPSGKRTEGIGGERLVPKRKYGHFLPFRNIGREVANPIQALLAAWLLLLTAGICLSAARMVRRRGHRLN